MATKKTDTAQAEQAKADRLAAALAAFRLRTSSAALFPKK